MTKAVFVLGMDITWNSARGDSAQLNISRPFVRSTVRSSNAAPWVNRVM